MTSKTDLTSLGEVVSTDVLIIGGGVAGLPAAIKARQARPSLDVLVVDKATPGYAGQGPKEGKGAVKGSSMVITEEQLEEWLKWKVETGSYLNDQEFVYAIGKDTFKVYQEIADWGAPLDRDEKGKMRVTSSDPYRSTVGWLSPDMMQFLRGKAQSEGARILKRIMIVELLTEGERVAGAVGFSIDSGQFYILKAKATIIANGSCLYRYRRLFTYNAGEGVSMAYNVGAEMRNAEFGNTTNAVTKFNGHGAHRTPPHLENAKGENLFQKYGIPIEGSDFERTVLAMKNEIEAGRGPIYYAGGGEERTRKRLGIPLDQKVEATFSTNARPGPIRVDLHCRTTVPGLWAIGDACMPGAAFTGAQAPNAIGAEGLPLAVITGYWAALDTADFTAEAAAPDINPAEVRRLKEQIFAPLERKQGFDPNDAIYQVQEAVIPVKYNVFRSGERMQEALAKVEDVKGRLPTLWAKDLHYLAKAHEAKSMALCAEMTYRAALMRKESRGFHMREDYPERDDQNWLKWIIIKKDKEEMKLWTEDVPIDKYKIKPPKKT
ncbi:FAD-dependent oxidoreductase [Chloroflexota bacterium]